MDSIRVKAYAKINPSLDVTGVRPDGYHEVRMLLQQIGLYDEILLEKCDDPGIHLTIGSIDKPRVLSADAPAPDDALASDSSNLAYRAAQLLTDTCEIAGGVRITLEKKIPVAAGLAGGSADAAAVLKGMNVLFDLKLPEETLRTHGLSLGADVPFCILGGNALAEGIGEILTPLSSIPACHILLVKPPEGISTGAVYRALDTVDHPPHPDIGAVLKACTAGDLSALCSCMGNILETVTLPILPRLNEIRTALLSAGAEGAMMSGSGPTMFGLFRSLPSAQAAEENLRTQYPDCRIILTHPEDRAAKPF